MTTSHALETESALLRHTLQKCERPAAADEAALV